MIIKNIKKEVSFSLYFVFSVLISAPAFAEFELLDGSVHAPENIKKLISDGQCKVTYHSYIEEKSKTVVVTEKHMNENGEIHFIDTDGRNREFVAKLELLENGKIKIDLSSFMTLSSNNYRGGVTVNSLEGMTLWIPIMWKWNPPGEPEKFSFSCADKLFFRP